MERIAKERFIHLDTSRWEGRIEKLASASKSKFLVLKEDTTKYLHLNTYEEFRLNKNTQFESFAEPGDSVFKEKYGDTIYLFKDNQVYKYTFHEVDY